MMGKYSGTRVGKLARFSGAAAILVSLPGCQSITGSPSLAQIRVIDTSPDAPGIDVYQGSAALVYNLGPGSVTSYTPITPGNYVITADTAGSKQQLASAGGSFVANGQYTVLIGNFAAELQELILRDQSLPAPTGEIAIRVFDQSTRSGTVDLYMVPSGSNVSTTTPLIAGISFDSNSGYINIPTGTYTLVVLPAGTTPTAKGSTLYTGPSVSYAGGAASTLVMLDLRVPSSGIQVITANDYEPQ